MFARIRTIKMFPRTLLILFVISCSIILPSPAFASTFFDAIEGSKTEFYQLATNKNYQCRERTKTLRSVSRRGTSGVMIKIEPVVVPDVKILSCKHNSEKFNVIANIFKGVVVSVELRSKRYQDLLEEILEKHSGESVDIYGSVDLIDKKDAFSTDSCQTPVKSMLTRVEHKFYEFRRAPSKEKFIYVLRHNDKIACIEAIHASQMQRRTRYVREFAKNIYHERVSDENNTNNRPAGLCIEDF